MTASSADHIGMVLVAARRAIFRRTNKYGVERFWTFGAKFEPDSVSASLIGAAIVLLSVGTCTPASSHMDSWGSVVMAPVAVLMLYLLLGLT